MTCTASYQMHQFIHSVDRVHYAIGCLFLSLQHGSMRERVDLCCDKKIRPHSEFIVLNSFYHLVKVRYAGKKLRVEG